MHNDARQEVINAIKSMIDTDCSKIDVADVYINTPITLSFDEIAQTLQSMQQEGLLVIGEDEVITVLDEYLGDPPDLLLEDYAQTRGSNA